MDVSMQHLVEASSKPSLLVVSMDLRSELNKQPKILVIDDELANFEVIEALLHKENYKLYYTISGQQCFAQIATIQPDVILLDVMMPEVDGIEVCRWIKQNAQWQNIPVLMVTALNNKKDLAKCLSSNADDLISKPLTGLELRTRVRVMVKLSQQYQTIQNMHEQLRVNQIQLVNPSPESVVVPHLLPVHQPSQLPCYT
jgi:two-component system, sensor histidine kinase and response regulator